MSTLFISHSSRDNVAAAQLQAQLERQGHRSVFLDFDPDAGIQAGVSWERTLYTKLRACRAVIALCSDSYLASQWCFAEIALARMEGKDLFVLQIDPWSAQTRMPSILTVEQNIDLRTRPEEGYRRLWNGLKLKGIIATEARDWKPDEPPYPGLRAFREDDAPIFFGRDEEIREGAELLNRMGRQGHPRLMMVLGSSGSGKSSMVLAGMLPRLRRDTAQWRLLRPFRPGQQPMRELAASLARAFEDAGRALSREDIARRLEPAVIAGRTAAVVVPETPDEEVGPTSTEAGQRLLQALTALEHELTGADDQVANAVRHLKAYLGAPKPGTPTPQSDAPSSRSSSPLVKLAIELRDASGTAEANVVLVIDQFEELLGHDASHPAKRFLALLRNALEEDDSPLLVIGTMRSDYLGVFQRCPELQGVGFRSLPVGPMSVDGIRQIIEEPARLGQVQLENGLADLLLKDADTPDALPLLAFTLRMMWDRYRGDRLLAIVEYREIGGLHGAIAQVAEETYQDALKRYGNQDSPGALAKQLRDAFLGMARPAAEGSGWSRQPMSWDQLDGKVRRALDSFIDPQRLLVKRQDGTVEVAHEALFRSWHQLKGWLDANTESLHLLREIRDQAQMWEKAASDLDKEPYLFRGGRLARALELQHEGALRLNDLDRAFVEASDQAERAQAAAEERRRKRQLRRTRSFAAAIGIAFLVAIYTWHEAEEQRSVAEQQRRMLLAEAHKNDPVLGRLISREVPGRPAGWTSIVADQARYRVPQLHQLGTGHKEDDVVALASGTGGRFATGNGKHEVWLWEREPGNAGGSQPSLLGAHEARLWDMAFSLSGNTIGSSDHDGIVKLWNAVPATDARPMHVLAHQGQAIRVRLSRDGKVVAVLTEDGEEGLRAVTVWHLDGSARRSHRIPARKNDVETAIAVSPDGSKILLGYRSGKLELRSTKPGASAREELPADHAAEIRHVAFGDSDTRMASADKDGGLWWRAGPGQEKKVKNQWAAPEPLALRLARDRILVAGISEVYVGEQGTAAGAAPPFFPEFFQLKIRKADFDGERLIASIEERNGVSIWTMQRAPEPVLLQVTGQGCVDRRAADVVYLADGRLLATYEHGTVRMWSGFGPDPAKPGGGVLTEVIHAPALGCGADGKTPGAVPSTTMSASRDGTRFAIAYRDGRILVGDIAAGPRTAAAPAAFPPAPEAAPTRIDGRSCELPGTHSDQKRVGPSTVWTIAFDPDGKSLVAGLQDGRVRILDLATKTWADVGRHDGPVCKVDWARGGGLLVSASLDEAARIWKRTDGKFTGESTPLPHTTSVYTASFDAAGRHVVSGADSQLRLWDMKLDRPVERELPGKYDISVRAAAFSPDGAWVLSGGGNRLGMNCLGVRADRSAAPCEDDRMVQVNTPNEVPEAGTVRAVAISPVQPRFAVVDAAGELNVYRTDYRTVLWQQQTSCMRVADRRQLLRESAKEAERAHRRCTELVAACRNSSAECTQALAKTALR